MTIEECIADIRKTQYWTVNETSINNYSTKGAVFGTG